MDYSVVAAFLVVGILEIVFPLALGYLIVKKTNAKWLLFFYGAAGFVLVQLLHVPLVVVTQAPAYAHFMAAFGEGILAFACIALFLGLLAGLFEEVGRYVIFKRFFPKLGASPDKKNALLFGAGWGGIESALVGLIVLLSVFSYLYAEPVTDEYVSRINESTGGTLTGEQVQLLEEQNEALMKLTPLDLLPSLVERLMTVLLHVTWTLMVASAALDGKKRRLYLAIGWHAAVDATVVYVANFYGIFLSEAALFAFALIGVLYLKRYYHSR